MASEYPIESRYRIMVSTVLLAAHRFVGMDCSIFVLDLFYFSGSEGLLGYFFLRQTLLLFRFYALLQVFRRNRLLRFLIEKLIHLRILQEEILCLLYVIPLLLDVLLPFF